VIALACGLLLGALLGNGPGVDGAESTGRIDGLVVDAITQAPLAAATVRLEAGGRESQTDAQGRFSIDGVRAGAYALAVRAELHDPLVRPDVLVRPGRASTIRLELRPTFRASEDVLVASYFEEPKTAPPGSLTLGQEELRRSPGSGGDVSRALYTVPSVVQVDSSSNDLVVRGGSPFENGFYLDNIPFPNINHFPQEGASGGNIGILNVDFIDDLRLLVGGFGARYGSRLSSVVDIRYREGDRQRTQGLADLNAAGFGLEAEGPVSGRGSWMVSAKRSYLDLVSGVLGTGGTPRFGDVQGKVVFDLSPRQQLELLSVTGDSRFARSPAEAVDSGQAQGDEHHVVGASGVNWRAFWSAAAFSETSVSYGFVRSQSTWASPLSPQQVDRTDYLDGAFNVRSITSVRLRPRHRLDGGFDAALRDGRGWDDGRQQWVTVRGTEGGAFASIASDLWAGLSAEAGLRVERQPYAGRLHVLPRLSMAVRVSSRLTLNAAAGRYVQRLPFFLTKQDPRNEALADPQATHLVAGVIYQPAPHTRITLDAYEKRYSSFPLSAAVPWRFVIDDVSGDNSSFDFYGPLVDSGRALARGLELVYQRKMAGGFHALVGGSLARSRYRDLSGVWRNRTFDNRFVGNASLGWRPSRAWEAGLRFVLAGGRAVVPIDESASAAAGYTVWDTARAMEDHLPTYHALDLRVDRRFYFRKTSLAAYLSVWNAYDHANVRSLFWSPITRRVEAEHQWGILPVIGIQYAF
jgi:Carboxypeptidase regulatory-like domain/TonB-dependent Receptor Plug Domain